MGAIHACSSDQSDRIVPTCADGDKAALGKHPPRSSGADGAEDSMFRQSCQADGDARWRHTSAGLTSEGRAPSRWCECGAVERSRWSTASSGRLEGSRWPRRRRVACGWVEPDTVRVMKSWRSGSKRRRPSWKSNVTAGPRRSGRSSLPWRRPGRFTEWDTVEVAGRGQLDDPIAAKALADLSHAPTLRTAEILLDQVQGALGHELERLRREARLGTKTIRRGARSR